MDFCVDCGKRIVGGSFQHISKGRLISPLCASCQFGREQRGYK